MFEIVLRNPVLETNPFQILLVNAGGTPAVSDTMFIIWMWDDNE